MDLESLTDDVRADIVDETNLLAVIDEITSLLDQILQDIAALQATLQEIQRGE